MTRRQMALIAAVCAGFVFGLVAVALVLIEARQPAIGFAGATLVCFAVAALSQEKV